MIMAVSGGAVLPPLIGIVSTAAGIIAGLSILLFGLGYIAMTSIYIFMSERKTIVKAASQIN